MVVCCTCCSSDDVTDDDERLRLPRSPTSRPLLRMRWGRASPDESKATLLEGGVVFKFAAGRYTLCSEVGRGAHCVVWRCLRVSKLGEPRTFALKVHVEETAAFKREEAALKALSSASTSIGLPELFPRLIGNVRVQGRTGLAMPLFGPDLYVLQKLRERRPFPTPFVWSVATQLLHALEVLDRCGLVHADIKPQNVVLHSPDHHAPLTFETRITLIDLGSCLTSEQLGAHNKRITYVQSRWYRAPEVLLWSPISNAADAWSVGCVIAEVALGVPLLPGESEYNQLCRITALLGPPPDSLLERSRRADHFFILDERSGQLSLNTERASVEPPLIRYLPHDDFASVLTHLIPSLAAFERDALLVLLDGLLDWEPNERWAGSRLLERLDEELGATHPGGRDGDFDNAAEVERL